MIDLAGLPLVPQTPGQTGDQSVTAVGGFQQNGSAIGTALLLVKSSNDGLGKNLREQQTLCRAIVDHAEASFVASNTVFTTSL
jgi:hypothetical protein